MDNSARPTLVVCNADLLPFTFFVKLVREIDDDSDLFLGLSKVHTQDIIFNESCPHVCLIELVKVSDSEDLDQLELSVDESDP